MRFPEVSLSFLLLVGWVLAAPALAEPDSTGDTMKLSQDEIALGVLGAMDRTADPCKDFYQYSCGSWLENTDRPADQAIWVRSFSTINERNREVIRDILESAAADPGSSPDAAKIGHYYGSCMDEAAVEERGAKPLEPLFARIAEVEDADSFMKILGELHRRNVNPGFGVGVFPDFQNPDLNIAWLFQGGLGMPDRDYYVSEDETKQALLAEYETHVARMLGLLGDDEATAAANAAAVLAFETTLAENSRPAQEMRDWERLYNKIDFAGLQDLTPGLSWKAYLNGIGYPRITDLSVTTPEFFEALETLVAESSPETLQTYLRWHAVDATANLLSSDFVTANFEFYNQKLFGQPEMKARWKRCVSSTQGALGEVIGRVYVERMFGGSSKEVATEMIHDIEGAFEGILPGLAWMDDTTRGRALEKVGTLQNKIGYPDQWRDYSGLETVEGDYFANAMAGIEFDYDYMAAKIGQAVDRGEWGMDPQEVNAYYNPLWNEIAFPAGILQPPMFHKDYPKAMNYGGIGVVIGHELTHGFDDQGRKFDPQGRMSEWWEPEVAGQFEERAQCVDDKYSAYEVEPGVNVNGKLTLGENIADIGGLKQAVTAYRAWESRQGEVADAVEGLSNEQLLFVAFAQVWCSLASPEVERVQVTTDPHSPSRFRVIGALSTNPDFADAFSCAEGTTMNPKNKCEVW